MFQSFGINGSSYDTCFLVSSRVNCASVSNLSTQAAKEVVSSTVMSGKRRCNSALSLSSISSVTLSSAALTRLYRGRRCFERMEGGREGRVIRYLHKYIMLACS